MKTIVTFLLLALFPICISAQNPIVFQPGPGLNDSTDQGGINSGKDSWVNEGDGAYNGGSDAYCIATPLSNCNSTNTVAFFQFDLSGLPLAPDSVFFGVTHYEHTAYCYSNCNADFYFAPMAAPWYEQTITYSNFPAWGASFYGPINITFPNNFGNKEYNITSMYNQWKSGSVPNYGFAVNSQTLGCNNAAVYFYVPSSDDTASSSRPYLKIYSASIGMPENNSGINVSIFPNPAKQFVNIHTSSIASKIIITDALGREMLAVNPKGKETRIETCAFAKGIYFVNIYSEKGKTTERLVISE